MDDKAIVELYWERNEQAIDATAEKYGSYCNAIALRILGNVSDAEECVNDTYQAAWTSIPPNRPATLSTYLGKITRRICLKILRSRETQKRGCGELALSLEELHECIDKVFSVFFLLSILIISIICNIGDFTGGSNGEALTVAITIIYIVYCSAFSLFSHNIMGVPPIRLGLL